MQKQNTVPVRENRKEYEIYYIRNYNRKIDADGCCF